MRLFDQNDIEKVKQTSTLFNDEVPESVWKEIETELDLEESWISINTKLDGHIKKKRIRTSLLYLLLFLFCISGTAYLLYYSSPIQVMNGKRKSDAFVPPVTIQAKESKTVPNKKKYAVLNPVNNFRKDIKNNELKFSENSKTYEVKTGDYISQTSSFFRSEELHSMPVKQSILSFEWQPRSLLMRTDTTPKMKVRRLSVGINCISNNTYLINNDFREGNNENRLVLNSPSFTFNFGVNVTKDISESTGIAINLDCFSKQKQRTSYYEMGHFFEKETNINLVKTSLLFEKRIPLFGHRIRQNFTIRAGLYFSVLTSKNLTIKLKDQTVSSSALSVFKNNDYGLQFCLGRSFVFSNNTFFAGIQGEYGMCNIYRGSKKLPSQYNVSRFVNHGIVISYRYKIK